MKNIQSQIKLQIFAVLILLAGAMVGAAQETRFVSKYKVAFQPPKMTVKSPDSTEQEITFNKEDTSGVLQFLVGEEIPDEGVAKLASADKVLTEALMRGYLSGVKEGFPGAEVKLLEKSRVTVAGFNSFKVIVSMVSSEGIRLRGATYMILVPAHKRIYSFNIVSLESNFDKWLTEAETAVKSFEVLKAGK